MNKYSPYHFNAKEVDPETGYYYYGARYYNSNLSIWLSVDPLADKMPSWSPYAFNFNNPIVFVDPDGRIPWPVYEKFKNWVRRIDSYFGMRGSRMHNGLDINFSGGGNTDRGAPVLATHSGTVVRVRGIDDDSDAGGNRILIRNSEGKVETYYMHLNEKPNLKEGDVVEEGDVIGYIGGSGKGKSDNYTAHLHYEMHRQNEDGEWVPISPVDADGNLIDPQNFIPDNSANTSTE